jgi:hypothetical protein
MNLDPPMMNIAGTFGITSTTVHQMTVQAIRAGEPGSSGRIVNRHLLGLTVSPDLIALRTASLLFVEDASRTTIRR